MKISADFLEAKKVLSSRLLRAGLRGAVIGMRAANQVSVAATQARANVHAVGIGVKLVAGKATPEPCVRFYVVQKIAPSLLRERDLLPSQVDGLATDVIESPPAYLAAARKKAAVKAVALGCTDLRRKRQRPVIAGISAAHEDVTAGTIGYFCRSTLPGDDPNQIFVLSNNHVFADVNAAVAGDQLFQPGPADGATATDHFAAFHRFVKIKMGGTQANAVDASIGKLLDGVPFRARICRIGKVTGTATATEDMRVRKHGRTTGLTNGVVTDVNYDALVGLSHTDDSIVGLFTDQIRIEGFAPTPIIGLGGDSGSLVVNAQRKAVGLYFAGPDVGTYGIANHIGDVLQELKITLV